jgi:hypothetical protein
MLKRLIPCITWWLSMVEAKAIDIDVGKGASLSFAPNTLTAAVGDT